MIDGVLEVAGTLSATRNGGEAVVFEERAACLMLRASTTSPIPLDSATARRLASQLRRFARRLDERSAS